MRNTFLFVLALFLLSACEGHGERKNTPEKPNIVFIMADDLSYRDLSCYGQEVYQTPNLDALATGGVRFTQAYSAAPACAASRGSLLTGLNTGRGPIRNNGSALGQHPIAPEDLTIAEVLKEQGYATGMFGKWGLGDPGSGGEPYLHGFDLSFGYYSQIRAHTYFPDFLWENDRKVLYPENAGFDMRKRYKINKVKDETVFNTYDSEGRIYVEELKDPQGGTFSENEIERRALEFVTDHKKEPFFLYYATQLPHGPVIVDDFSAMKDLDTIPQPNREWAAMVIKLDDFVGKLVEKLKEEGLYENTIIFFASDNGYTQCGTVGRGSYPDWPDDPWFRNKGPFTGGKFHVLEGGCRVPFFVSWEGQIAASVCSEPVWLPDFFPTAAKLAGDRNSYDLDATDLWPILSGREEDFAPHEYMYFSNNLEQAVRMGPWKGYRTTPADPIRIYLVEEDTYGERDLSAIYPEVVSRIEHIMNTAYTPHEWYWTPNESAEDYQAKVKKARETGQTIPLHFPNGITQKEWQELVFGKK